MARRGRRAPRKAAGASVTGSAERAARRRPFVPSASRAKASTMPARPQNTDEDDLIIPVYGNTTFGCNAYPINGGLASMFPWAANDGRRFEKYRLKALEYRYVAAISEYNTNAPGNVGMAIDFDSLDSVPTTMVAHQQNRVKSFCAPYDSARRLPVLGGNILRVPAADLARRGWLYNRTGSVPSGADAKTYDLGSLLVAVTGSASTDLIGNIFVHAVIEYDVQQNVTAVGSKWSNTAGLDADSLVGTVANGILSTGSNAGWSQTDPDTFTCTVAGTYMVSASIIGTTLVSTTLNVGSRGTATVSVDGACANAAATQVIGQVVVSATVGQTFKPALTSAASVASAGFRFAEYNLAAA